MAILNFFRLFLAVFNCFGYFKLFIADFSYFWLYHEASICWKHEPINIDLVKS